MQGDSLTFLGGAGTVTGSKHLLRVGAREVLLDCGIFQGLKALRLRNWQALPFDIGKLEAVVLSHAHLDHCGYLPVLARSGFANPIYCTPGSAALLELTLRDAAKLQEEDARRANVHQYTRHKPALPLFTLEDAELALQLVKTSPYGERFEVTDGITAQFHRAGHILGSAIVDIELHAGSSRRIVFSGDLGRWGRPILRDPVFVQGADVLLVESTYGDREHALDPDEQLASIVHETFARGGTLVIPAFAIGRTQELLWHLRDLREAGRIPHCDVAVDAPMATDVTAIYAAHPEEHDAEMHRLITSGRSPFSAPWLRYTRSPDESRALNLHSGRLIIIAGSGMATGGRVLHHLERLLPDSRNTVLLSGFQAAGTRGRALQDGAQTVRFFGEDVPVHAHIATVNGLSAHADRTEILRWLRGFERPPARTYIVHGEPSPSEALAALVRSELGWEVEVARDGQEVAL